MKFWQRALYILAILLVVAVAAGLRLRAVNKLPIDYDEDDYLRAGQLYAEGIHAGNWAVFMQENYRPEHPPLSKIVYGLVLSFLPDAPLPPDRSTAAPPAAALPQPQFRAARLASATLGTLEALAVAILNPVGGFFLGIHTFTIKYTSQVMLEALPALTSMLAVLLYSRSCGHRKGWLAASAIFLGLTAAAKYPYALAGVAIGAHWLWIGFPEETESREASAPRAGPRKTGLVFAWVAVSLVTFFLADPYLWPDPIGRLLSSLLYHGGYAGSAAVQQAGYPMWQPLVWLFQSVPWHPGVFVLMLDPLIAILAIVGLRRLWQKHTVFALWLGITLVFLLLWPTKWAQYILMVTAPVSLAAGEGFLQLVWDPITSWIKKVRTEGLSPRRATRTPAGTRRDMRRALPWLVPGLVAICLIALFPLVYQLLMSLTDFRSISIRDGLQGGVFREAWKGLTGQIRALPLDQITGGLNQKVHYTGLQWYGAIFSGDTVNILVFEIIWTVLAVSLQAALGIGVALLLHRRGIRFKRWWQTLFIIPWAIPEFVGAMVWMRLFNPSYGWITLGIQSHAVPLPPISPYSSPNSTLVVLLMAATWYGWPLMLLAASASLNMISPEVYEAAALDGAGAWSQFRLVTWPLLMPLLIPVIIIRGIFAFNQFYLFYVMQAPLATLSTISFYIFDPIGYNGGQFAVSAMINVVTVIILVILLLLFNRWSRAAEGVTYA